MWSGLTSSLGLCLGSSASRSGKKSNFFIGGAMRSRPDALNESSDRVVGPVPGLVSSGPLGDGL